MKGKCIIFVADIDRCYRLKLYLEQFGVKSVILNSEKPVNSRINVVNEFNKGIYDIIIASDEHEVMGDEDEPKVKNNKEVDEEPEEAPATVDGGEKTQTETKEPSKKKRKIASKKDKEYGVSRGIDFKNVSVKLLAHFRTIGLTVLL